jgi:hypothetical protein
MMKQLSDGSYETVMYDLPRMALSTLIPGEEPGMLAVASFPGGLLRWDLESAGWDTLEVPLNGRPAYVYANEYAWSMSTSAPDRLYISLDQGQTWTDTGFEFTDFDSRLNYALIDSNLYAQIDQNIMKYAPTSGWEVAGQIDNSTWVAKRILGAKHRGEHLVAIYNEGNNKVELTLNGGQDWVRIDPQFNPPLQIGGVKELHYDPYRECLWALTGAGVARYDLSQLDSPEPGTVVQPVVTEFQVYPNPLNDQGKVSFSLREPTELSVKLYTIQGRLVKTIRRERFTAGSHQILLDADALASGSYYLHLAGKNVNTAQKLLVLK